MKRTVSSLANTNVQEKTGKLTFWGFGGQNQNCIFKALLHCCKQAAEIQLKLVSVWLMKVNKEAAEFIQLIVVYH